MLDIFMAFLMEAVKDMSPTGTLNGRTWATPRSDFSTDGDAGVKGMLWINTKAQRIMETTD